MEGEVIRKEEEIGVGHDHTGEKQRKENNYREGKKHEEKRFSTSATQRFRKGFVLKK